MALGILLLILAYFVPTVVAVMRSHKDLPAIAAINILFGWTVAGWFVSFVWALSDPRGRAATQTVVVNTAVSAAAAPSPTEAKSTGAAQTSEDAELAYWDRIDRSDPFQLEEFLVRFPDGRFARLARARFEALQGAPVKPSAAADTPQAPPKPSTEVCRSCGTELEADDRFCADCGSPVPA